MAHEFDFFLVMREIRDSVPLFDPPNAWYDSDEVVVDTGDCEASWEWSYGLMDFQTTKSYTIRTFGHHIWFSLPNVCVCERIF